MMASYEDRQLQSLGKSVEPAAAAAEISVKPAANLAASAAVMIIPVNGLRERVRVRNRAERFISASFAIIRLSGRLQSAMSRAERVLDPTT